MEFENICIIHKDNPDLKKYTTKDKREEELSKEKELSDLILNFYKKVYDKKAKSIDSNYFSFDFNSYGYNISDGYYAIYGGKYGYYEVVIFKDNIKEIFISIAESIIEKNSYYNVEENKKRIKSEYIDRFGNYDYIWKLYETEYTLDKWNKYYDGNIPQELIDKYINRIKIDNAVVSYNSNTLEINVDKEIKIRKLTSN